MAVSFSVEDRAFVQIAVDECKRLGLEKYSPTAMIWAGPRLPPDQCLLFHGYLYLPHSMNGRLQPEEWRPIIASAALQRYFGRRKGAPLIRSFVLYWAIAFFIIIVSTFVAILIARSLRIGPISGPLEPLLSLPILAVPATLGLVWRYGNIRKQRLRADTQVSDEISKKGLFETLKKIQSFGLRTDPGRIRNTFSGWPTISQRIRNLEKGAPSSRKTHPDEAFRKN